MERRTLLFATASALACPHIVRADEFFDVELCLLLDYSGSMTEDGDIFVQNDGHVAALRSQEVQRSLGLWLPLRISVYLWADHIEQLFWQVVKEPHELHAVADALEQRAPVVSPVGTGTDHLGVLQHFINHPKQSLRRVIDISTDEPPGALFAITCANARDQLYREGNQVNGLAIDKDGTVAEPLRQHVLTPNAVLVKIAGFESYNWGIRRKMELDVGM